jgi:hypothetical protein
MYSDLNNSFTFLLDKPNKIPKWIFKNTKFLLAFLAGYADCEATWDIRKSNKNNIRFTFRIRTSDFKILQQLANKLNKENYYATLNLEKEINQLTNLGKYNENFWCLAVQRKKDVVRLASKLLNYSRHYEKIRKMKLITKNSDKMHWNEIQELIIQLRKSIKKEHLKSSDNLDYKGVYIGTQQSNRETEIITS